jgi:hypothetical protein
MSWIACLAGCGQNPARLALTQVTSGRWSDE